MCVLIWHVPAYAQLGIQSAQVASDARAYRLCLAQKVTAVEDRISPPKDVVAAVSPYCNKERSVLWMSLKMSAFLSTPNFSLIEDAETWAASYVVAIRSCNAGSCGLLTVMQRDGLGIE